MCIQLCLYIPFLCDLDPDTTTLTHKLDLDIPKIYRHTKNEVLSQGFQKLEHKQDKHTLA